MYTGAEFSFRDDFLDYLGLANTGEITLAGEMTEAKLNGARELGKNLL